MDSPNGTTNARESSAAATSFAPLPPKATQPSSNRSGQASGPVSSSNATASSSSPTHSKNCWNNDSRPSTGQSVDYTTRSATWYTDTMEFLTKPGSPTSSTC